MADQIHVLFAAQTTDGDSPSVFPARGKEVLVQFTRAGTFTSGIVTLKGRVSSAFDWVLVSAFDQNTPAANQAVLVKRFPEFMATVSSLTGAGATVRLAIAETEV
jgi:hypothetical protein